MTLHIQEVLETGSGWMSLTPWKLLSDDVKQMIAGKDAPSSVGFTKLKCYRDAEVQLELPER